MITASMTSGEMRRVRNLDETRIYEFQMRKANELKREMKRQKVRQITKTFEFATPNADYFIVVGVKHGDVFAPDRDYGGVTYSDAVRKSDKRRGVLVSFQCSKDMSMDYCCHEASHACDAIEDALGMEHGDEPSAYLIGWIASCINKARLGIGNFVEIIDKKDK